MIGIYTVTDWGNHQAELVLQTEGASKYCIREDGQAGEPMAG